MSVAARLGAFALVLAAVFAAAAFAGRAAGPFERGIVQDPHGAEGEAEHAEARPAGLAVAEDGLRLEAPATELDAARPQQFTFAIRGEDGEPLEEYDVTHEREMHLVVVSRDLGTFLHLHPERRPGGSWETTLELPGAGAYRAFADFSTDGTKRTLGVDLFARGDAAPAAQPAAGRTATVDGYRVELGTDELRAGDETTLHFEVTRDGSTVAVGRYLGARGHLVVLREGDLAYLHTHAEEDALEFETTFPSPGRYRAFLQFSAGGSVHTAPFALEVGE
jgi:hypothetical protein